MITRQPDIYISMANGLERLPTLLNPQHVLHKTKSDFYVMCIISTLNKSSPSTL